MPKYKSTNSETRYYPTLAVMINPNEIVDLAEPIEAAGLEAVGDKKIKDPVATMEGDSVNG